MSTRLCAYINTFININIVIYGRKFMKAPWMLLLLIVMPFVAKFSFGQENTAPNLGTPYGDVLSLEEESVIGFASYRSLQRHNLIVNDPLVQSYINYLGNRLTRNTLDTQRNYTFFITKSKSVNAFALPGGYIGLNSGLVSLTRNEDQLAGVVAHEIAHVNLRHAAEMVANTARTSLPAYLGMIIGIFAGNPQAGMAIMQSGLGMSAQMSINLIRSNEIEADEFAVELFNRANLDVKEMAEFFEIMQSATSSLNPQFAYFYTHPLYENRIARIKSRGNNKSNNRNKLTKDYQFVKNILEVSQTKNISALINSTRQDDIFDLHKLSLLYMKKSDYKTAKEIIQSSYEKEKDNVYLAVHYSQLLNNTNDHDEAIKVLEELRKIYPLNSSISFYLGETLIQNNLNLDYASEILESIEKSHKYNPNYLRLMSKMYNLQKDVFRSKIFLSDYHLLLDNLKLAVQVLNDGIQSRGLTGSQISVLKKKKNQIICKYQRPLEPIFGEKTCD